MDTDSIFNIRPDLQSGLPLTDPAAYMPKDIGWQALAPAISCTILATTTVAIRWITRLKLSRCHGLDDFLITLSLVVSWAMTMVIAIEVHDGIGVYATSRVTSHIRGLLVVANNLWILTVNITKASILAQYMRIFQRRNVVIICYALLVALFPAVLWGVLGGILLCSPIARLWEPSIPGHCMSPQAYWLSVAGIDIGLDILILLLPLPAMLSLQLRHKQKAVLILFFLLGFSVCAFSIARLVTVHVFAMKGDLVRSGICAIVWSTVEANVGIICASFLALKPLVSRIFPRLLEEESPTRNMVFLSAGAGSWWRSRGSHDAILTTPPRVLISRSQHESDAQVTSPPGSPSLKRDIKAVDGTVVSVNTTDDVDSTGLSSIARPSSS